MKYFLLLLLFISTSAFCQELKLIKATKQIVHAGASPSSFTNYKVLIKKNKSFNWSIDSIVNIFTQKTVPYTIMKVNNADAASSKYQQVKIFSKRDKGVYEITFSATTSKGNGKPVNPSNKMVISNDFTNGAIIYYSSKNVKKQISIDSFEQLETLNAP